MSRRIVPAAALLLIVGVPGAALGGETAAGPSSGTDRPAPDAAQAACRTIAAIMAVYPTMKVDTTEGPVRNMEAGAERPGCRVFAASPARGLVGEVPPDSALRDLMGQLGWEEDPLHTADGPGTASFALRKKRVLCFVSGGAPSGIEEGRIFRAATYELSADCTADAEGEGPAPK